MGYDIHQSKAVRDKRMADYQQKIDAAKAKDKLLQQERTLEVHKEIQAEMFKMASEGMGKLVWANGNLSYEHGKDAKMSKLDLYNHFSKYASGKNINLDKEAFDGLYEQYKATQNDLWLESFRYATATGAREKDVHELFRRNERFAKDFMEVESTGFAPDDPNKLEFSAYKPSGEYMRHGDSWMGTGAWAEWMGENPWKTAGIGAGVAGAGYMARGPIGRGLKGGYGMIGGKPGLAAIGIPMALQAMGAPEGIQTAAGVASSGYFLGKAGETLYKNQIHKAVSHLPKKDLVSLAKNLNVDSKALKGTKPVVEKALGDRMRASSGLKIRNAVKKLDTKAAKTVGQKLWSWSGRATKNIGKGATRGSKIGAAAMAAYSIYDLATTLLADDEPLKPYTTEVSRDELESIKAYLKEQGLETQ
jgi:hypothetical protein